MCHDCDNKFNHMAQHFDDSMAVYRQDWQDGNVRDTVAQRVMDNAAAFFDMPDQDACRTLGVWYAAIAMERLMALELSGIPT